MKIYTIALAIALLVATVGCNGTVVNPVQNGVKPVTANNAPAANAGRILWGMWDIGIDLETLSATVMPNRDIENHFNVLPFLSPPKCADCLKLHVNSFDEVKGILDLDVTLKNKFAIAGYDVRGVVFTDDLGHGLKNSDASIDLYDIPGGATVNPFIAYAKDDPQRKFPGKGELTENYQITVPNPPKFLMIKYAVDASYPSNCAEPYSIGNFVQGKITSEVGSHATVSVDVKDWQGDVDMVKLNISLLNDTPLMLTHQTGDTWSGELVNAKGVSAGGYNAVIVATSTGSGTMELFYMVAVNVSEFTPKVGWAKTWGGDYEDWGTADAVDSDGNVYVTGHFWNTADFDPDPVATDIHVSNGVTDIFLSKFDSTGALVWAITWGGNNGDYAYGIKVDGSSNIYVVGGFESPSMDFDPGTGVDLHSPTGDSSDCFLAKYDSSGAFLWAQTWGGDNYERCADVDSDSSGNVYVTGEFLGFNADFDPGTGEDIHASNGNADVFLSKFDSGGDFGWARTWGSPKADWGDRGAGVAADAFQNVYVAGSFWETADFDTGAGEDLYTSNGWADIFLTKFDSLGNFEWARTWGGSDFDWGNDVALNSGGHPYVTGEFASADVDFNPGPGETIISSSGDYDAFINKIDSSGIFTSVITWGGPQYDTGNKMSFDNSGNLYVTGVFTDTVDFDPGAGVDEHQAIGTSSDLYLCSFDMFGAFKWANTWGGTDNDRANGVAADASGAYVTGEFLGTGVDFDPGIDVDLHTSVGNTDIFLSKFKVDGGW
jgi:hypothetical protein